MEGRDRVQRIIIGLILISFNLMSNGLRSGEWTAVAALVIQIELMVTGLIGWCPLYWSFSLGKRKGLD